jgi:hypothetical protein
MSDEIRNRGSHASIGAWISFDHSSQPGIWRVEKIEAAAIRRNRLKGRLTDIFYTF